MAYSGAYKPKNPQKYDGDSRITYRSLWERGLMIWCDDNAEVKRWSSEQVVIPYISPVDNRAHRYYMDFKIEFTTGNILLVEVKPEYQTVPPVKAKHRKSSKFLTEAKTFAVNDAKWNAAERYAKKRGWKFVIFTEHTLTDLGINIVQKPTRTPRKKKTLSK